MARAAGVAACRARDGARRAAAAAALLRGAHGGQVGAFGQDRCVRRRGGAVSYVPSAGELERKVAEREEEVAAQKTKLQRLASEAEHAAVRARCAASLGARLHSPSAPDNEQANIAELERRLRGKDTSLEELSSRHRFGSMQGRVDSLRLTCARPRAAVRAGPCRPRPRRSGRRWRRAPRRRSCSAGRLWRCGDAGRRVGRGLHGC